MARARKRGRRTAPPPFPESTEARYLKALRRRVRVVERLIKRSVLPVLDGAKKPKSIKMPESIRNDAASDVLLGVLNLLRKALRSQAKPDRRFLRQLTAQVDRGVERYSASLVAGPIPLPPPFDPKDFIAENVKLIRSIDDDYLDRVAVVIEKAQREGWTAARAAQELSSTTEITLNRAKLIARDQIATVNSQITKQRQTAAGVERYRWSTSRDERVRPEHAEREGRVFSWDNPPPDGHPGEPINCRCVAIPIFDDAE
jgi:SPP1 gp7 family putative phage head morphogenesis protein